MPSKRPPSKPRPTPDTWQITDEWGLYDPAKAGMQALYARLGRPILTAAKTSSKKERRRAQRPERSSEGVGLAIAEARRRAGLLPDAVVDAIPQSATRAMREALKARQVVDVAAPSVDLPDGLDQQTSPPPVPEAAPGKRRGVRAVAKAAKPPVTAVEAEASATATPGGGRSRRAGPVSPKTRGRASAPDRHAAAASPPPAADSAPPATASPVATPARPAHPPAPSPRRPRGPVPLAAWARAVADSAPDPPRPADKRGFWRGVFLIPSEVALVEYAHGCRIQRLLIEAAAEPATDFI